MAEEAVKKLEENLKCAICFDTYSEPKALQCLHAYCRGCLVKLVTRNQQGQLILTCPTCRQITPVPANGVAGLQPAFHINEFFNIRDDLRRASNTTASTPENVDQTLSCSTQNEEQSDHGCSKHEGKELELYCETCGELICLQCALRGQRHHSHEYDLISANFEKYKEEMIVSLKPLEKQLERINNSLVEVDEQCERISEQEADIEAMISDTIRLIQETLDIRKTELTSLLRQLTRNKLKRLAAQRDEIETTKAKLSSCLEYINESMKAEDQKKVLKMKPSIEQRLNNLTSVVQQDMLKPVTAADIIFTTTPSDIMSTCQKYGHIFSSGSPEPSKCHAEGKGLQEAEVGRECTALLHVSNFNDEPCGEPLESLECELVFEITDTKVSGSMKRKGHSRYEINYQPTIKGRHQLHIKANKQHIKGSPFIVLAKLQVEKLGTPIAVISGLEGPWGVAIIPSGEIVITERDKHCISVFSSKGEKLQSFGKRGTAHGQFIFCHGLTVDSEAYILAIDTNNHRIQKFALDGLCLTAVGTHGNKSLQFEYPQDITFSPINGKIYVTDQENCRVQVLNSDLTFHGTFGRKGSGKGHFNNPRGIACDSAGRVYVADTWNHRIQVFTAEGKFLRAVGKLGQKKGELSFPIGVAVDTRGVIYVCDRGNDRVSVFSSEGEHLISFGNEESGCPEFDRPCGLAVDVSGVVYVCDYGNNTVKLY